MLSPQPSRIETSFLFRRRKAPQPQYFIFCVMHAFAISIITLAAVRACTNAVSREPMRKIQCYIVLYIVENLKYFLIIHN